MSSPRAYACIILCVALAAGPAIAALSTVYVVPIHGTIDLGLTPFIERVVHDAESARAGAVILDINTFGGRVDAATEIKNTLIGTKVRTIAYINKEAGSAGALIAIACDRLVMAPGATIGAATPVDLQGQKASEKVVSYLRKEMKSAAEANGHRSDFAEAMVDEDVEIPGIVPKGKILSLTAEEALRYGFIDTIAVSLDDVLRFYQLSDAEVIHPEITWAERVVRFVTDPIVSSLLLTLGMLGLLFELQSPGWGLAGAIGLLALGLFFGSHWIIRLADWVEIILFFIGAGLLLVEILFVPGFGLVGILGLGLMFVSLVLSLMSGQYFDISALTRALTTVGVSFLLTIAGSLLMLAFLPQSRLWRRIILQATVTREDRGTPEDLAGLIGAVGTAVTPLRPSGIGLFNNRRIQVVSEGEFILKEHRIQVMEVAGNRVVVREI